MGRNRSERPEIPAAIKLAAHQRVEAVWTCLDVLCPDLTPQAQKELARKVLDLSRGEDQKPPPRIMITPAQVTSIIWPNMQCINPRCPTLRTARLTAGQWFCKTNRLQAEWPLTRERFAAMSRRITILQVRGCAALY
jgi:hypothetical protein